MTLIDIARKARTFYPLATPKARATQASRYAAAVLYMRANGIEAARLGSEFKYERSTGSVL